MRILIVFVMLASSAVAQPPPPEATPVPFTIAFPNYLLTGSIVDLEGLRANNQNPDYVKGIAHSCAWSNPDPTYLTRHELWIKRLNPGAPANFSVHKLTESQWANDAGGLASAFNFEQIDIAPQQSGAQNGVWVYVVLRRRAASFIGPIQPGREPPNYVCAVYQFTVKLDSGTHCTETYLGRLDELSFSAFWDSYTWPNP